MAAEGEDREEDGTEGVAMEAAGEDAADAEVAATVAVEGIVLQAAQAAILRPLRIRASSDSAGASREKKKEKERKLKI